MKTILAKLTTPQSAASGHPLFSLIFAVFGVITLSESLRAQAPPAAIPPTGVPATAPPGVINQPVMVSSFEGVEMERLRLSEEVGKMERDELAFREQLLSLQKRLASASLQVPSPESIPTEYRTFLSVPEGDVESSNQYHLLLKSTLNDLVPGNPYQENAVSTAANPQLADQKLLQLSEFQEDDDISRTIRAQVAAVRGGQFKDTRRAAEIDRELAAYEKNQRDFEWNLKRTFDVSPLTGKASGSEADRVILSEKIAEIKARKLALEEEKAGVSKIVSGAVRKIQFQQLIVELAVQQRYIHSLIACGYYRLFSSDMSLTEAAYASQSGSSNQSKPEPNTTPATAPGSPSAPTPGSAANAGLPILTTIPSLEAFLLTRIRDAIRDRKAMERMLQENQISSAEGLLRKMITTAKYQPELHTIPYAERQRIYQLGQKLRELSDMLGSRDYEGIREHAIIIAKLSTDVGMSDFTAFANEHSDKGFFWARQAELSLKVGDNKSMQSFMDAALRRAPLDKRVKEKIDELQSSVVSDSKKSDELRRIVDEGNYRTAFERINEFGSLANNSGDGDLRTRFEALIEKEKKVKSIIEKCEVFGNRKSYPDVWMTLSNLDEGLNEDPRLIKEKSEVAGKCPKFILCYESALEKEGQNESALALAWYLSALAEAPGSNDLIEKITSLGEIVLHH